jgi:alpha-glucosidase
VSPATEQASEAVDVYLPDHVFYDFWTGQRLKGTTSAVHVMGVGWADIPIHIHGNFIIPMRVHRGMTTSESRSQNSTRVVAPGLCGTACGKLYLDDGISLDISSAQPEIVFTWDGAKLEATGTFGYDTNVVVESVKVLGAGGRKKTGAWSLGSAVSI